MIYATTPNNSKEELSDEEVKEDNVTSKSKPTASQSQIIKVNKKEFNKIVAQIVERNIKTEISKQKQFYDEKLQEQDKRYNKLNQDLGSTQKELTDVKKELANVKTKFNTTIDDAVRSIKQKIKLKIENKNQEIK